MALFICLISCARPDFKKYDTTPRVDLFKGTSCTIAALHDTNVCSAAAKGGPLAMLRWARANGCDWNRAICLQDAPAGSETRNRIEMQPA
jgi:hypothetical protein